MELPDEVQRLVLVPNPPPGPTLVQQVPVVLCSMCSDGVFAVVSPLLEVEAHTHGQTQRNPLNLSVWCHHMESDTEFDVLLCGYQLDCYLMKRESCLI